MAPSAGFRRTIFLRAARRRALRNDVREAEELLTAGVALPGSERELAARARIMEARGDIEGAIRALRDEKDADCRSVILSVIAKHKGDDDALDWFRDQSLSPADLTPIASWRCVKFTCAGKSSPRLPVARSATARLEQGV
jgi:hypothetical protein